MKKVDYSHIDVSPYRKNLIMFIETLEEVLFYYSFESYKLPALNSHFLCMDLLQAKKNIDDKSITEGNFIPLAEEFEDMLDNDIVVKAYIPEASVLLKRRDKLGGVVDYRNAEQKTKISKYSEAASYICEISRANRAYLTTIFDLLIDNIFAANPEYDNWDKIYFTTRALATELVNGGYSLEYISQELRNSFLDKKHNVKCEKQELIDFFSKFTFDEKSYQITFGINKETATILRHIKNLHVKKPTQETKSKLNLKHRDDCIVELHIKETDENEASNSAYGYINTVIGLHRISQHHKPVYIKPIAQVSEIDQEQKIISTKIVQLEKNILLRANNESQLQSYFFDDQLLNKIDPPESFFRAVSLHNSALDSKEPTNQLLDLWTAVETLIGFRSGDEDKIVTVCGILTSILNRAYLYTHMVQLHRDLSAILEGKYEAIIDSISGDEQPTWKLAKMLALSVYQDKYTELHALLEEYPLLQYRMEYFSQHVFVNSKSVYEELCRHKMKLKWQIMRIYRNRNMIVHNGDHMPYLNIILGNLHYYVDAMFDVLIEYYHLDIVHNHNIFYHIQKEEIQYWNLLGLDEKGKKMIPIDITETNYSSIIFNGYQGNEIKNLVQKAISTMNDNKEEVASS